MSLPLPAFEHFSILVVGDIMLDRYWSGAATRVSPEAPVPVVRVNTIEDRLGGAANVARNVAELGCQVTLCGIIGNDEAGVAIKHLLAHSKIRDCSVEQQSAPTITKLRIMSRHQQLLRVDFEEDELNYPQDEQLEAAFNSALASANAVILSDYAKGTLREPGRFIAKCLQRGIPVFVDPKGKDFSRYEGASYITPNRAEFEAEVGPCQNIEQVFRHAAQLLDRVKCEGILVTLGELGMALVRQNAEPIYAATTARDVFDVTGAGDTVIAALTACVAAGTPIREALKLANTAAGIVVGKLGTSTVSLEELRLALRQQNTHINGGPIPLETLSAKVIDAKKRGEKIVFTNGCFDILHSGHAHYLEQAAALGDRLIVAVNSDNSVRRLKGAKRPILPESQRLELVSSLRFVDWVVSFDADTPIDIIRALKPDVLVKGGDYSVENIVGYHDMLSWGGETLVLPYLDEVSTSKIVDKIKQLEAVD